MGIAEEEAKILEELAALEQEESKEEKPADELLEEVAPLEDDATGEEEEDDDEDDEEDNEDGDEDDEEEDEEEEEELRPAQRRHALKELKAEREQKEALQRELQEMKLQAARQQGREEVTPKHEAPAEEIPDQEIEPERYAIWKADKLEQRLTELQDEQARVNAQRQWEDMQSAHIKANPAYSDAKDFLLEKEGARIKAMYPSATEAQITQELKQQEYITAGNAAKAGIDPMQHIEFLAFQAGFRPGEAKAKPIKKKSNIDKIKKNAKKSASLIGGSQAGKSNESHSAEQLAAMGMDEIMKFGVDKYEAAIRKIEARS